MMKNSSEKWIYDGISDCGKNAKKNERTTPKLTKTMQKVPKPEEN